MTIVPSLSSSSAIKYFESLDASSQNLTFTKVWGKINSETIVNRKEEESAFGEPSVVEFTKTIREWVITGTSKPDLVYDIDDAENGITMDEIKEAMSNREIYLANIKKKNDEYQSSKASATSNIADAPASFGGFNF